MKEHNAFLRGLHTFGKGKWKEISQHFVPSRTCTQVASHAQKYYERAKSTAMANPNRKKSMFDIRLEGSGESPHVAAAPTTVDDDVDEPVTAPMPTPSRTPVLDAADMYTIASPYLLYNYLLMMRSASHFYTIPQARYPLYYTH